MSCEQNGGLNRYRIVAYKYSNILTNLEHIGRQ